MKASHAFYKVSKILSIVFLVITVVLTIVGAASVGAFLANNSFPIIEQGITYTRQDFETLLVLVIVVGVLEVAFLIANLVISIKASKENKKGQHIAAIVFGVLSGVIFDIPAAIIALAQNGNKAKAKESK